MEKNIRNVKVSLRPNKGFTIIGDAQQQLTFSQPEEQMAFFDIQVTEGASITEIEVVANGHGKKASYKVPINILNPNPLTTEVTSIVLEPNSTQEVALAAFGVTGSNSTTVELSSLPPVNFESRLQYLIRYPHGCIEQTTSAAFPQLYLGDIFSLTTDKKQRIQHHIEAAIKKMKRFMQPSGAMSYWPGYTSANDWGTTYAGHFLLEANTMGYVLPIGFKSNWIRYQQQQSKQWRKGHNDLAQAYRLYTLALAGNPDMASMNRLRLSKNLSNDAKLRLATAYGLVGQQKAANSLIQGANIDCSQKKNNYYTYGSVQRNRAMALETLITMDKKKEAQKVAVNLAKALSSKQWMSTQTTAYALLAMAKYAKYVGGKGIQAQYTLNGTSYTVATEKTLASSEALPIKKENTLVFKNN
ncbi:MAG: hypothetical protein AAFP96_07690, partial [Bacteroidota bacterium]